jgi:hypothetical protein
METTQKALRRRLLGVRTADVQQLLADRDVTALAAAEQVRLAEERARASEARASTLEARLAELAQAPPARETADSTDPHQLLMAVREEMARVMHATQEAGSKILEHTRSDVEQQLVDSERRHGQVEADRARLAAWVSELQQSSVGLRQGIVDAAGALNRTMGAMQEAERAVARMVGRMADSDGIIQRFQAASESQAQAGSSMMIGPPAHQPPTPRDVGVAENGNGFGAPKPPVDVSAGPIGPPQTVANGGANGEQEDSAETVVVGPGSPAVEPYGGDHAPERELATSWAAGPAGRRTPPNPQD